jgi:hypothetical protein
MTALSAVCSLLSALAFITVNWSGPSLRVVVAFFLTSIVLFFAGVLATILTAARDTYARGRRG